MKSKLASMRLKSIRFGVGALAVLLCGAGLTQLLRGASAEAPPELALQIVDYAALPITGSPDGTGNNAGSPA